MLLDLLQKRYSCRDFADKPIPREVIRYILECGRLAPSGGNEQPWKFGIVTDRELINELAKAAGNNYDQSWIASAQLVVAMCTQIFSYEADFADQDRPVDMGRFPSFHRRLKAVDYDLYTLISMEGYAVHFPGEHMVLAALERGVYSTWIASMDCEQAARLLGVTGYYVSELIAFGYPKTEKRPMPKKSLGEITFTNHFDNVGIRL